MSICKLLSTVVISGFFWSVATNMSAMIPDPRDEQISILKKERDFYATKADYLQKTSIIQQMFRGISNALWVDPGYQGEESNSTVDGGVWRQLLCSMRYFGGNTSADISNLVAADGTPGSRISRFMMHVSNPLGGLYTINNDLTITPNSDATLANFVDEDFITNVKSIADGSLLLGFRDIRDFVTGHFPSLAYILGHIGENDFYNINDNDDWDGTSINGSSSIPWIMGKNISEIIVRPFEELNSLKELGVADNSDRKTALMEDIKRLYSSNGL